MKTIISVVGARPQFIKLAPLAAVLDTQADIRHIIVHTGQHYDAVMSQVFFDSMNIRTPDYHYTITGDTQATQTAAMMVQLEETFLSLQPHAVILFGDTNTTLAGALVAAKLHLPIIHIEAGLRSFDRSMPEEVNRVITDHLSSYLSCASEQAKQNLLQEGLGDIAHVDGDIMFDAMLHFLPRAREQSTILNSLGLTAGEYQLLTLHRNFTVDNKERLTAIVSALCMRSETIIFPVHPRTKKQLLAFDLFSSLTEAPNIRVIEPVDYIDMLALLSAAKGVITDSGGLQKEAYLLKKPCITIRPNTEWVETVESGWNVLVCHPKTGEIDADLFAQGFIRDRELLEKQWHACYGDGHTVSRIISAITRL